MSMRQIVVRLVAAGLFLGAIGTTANIRTPEGLQWFPPMRHQQQVPPAMPHFKSQWLWLSICGRFDSGVCAGKLL